MRELLQRNLEGIELRVRAACDAAGRDPREVSVLPVTKSVPPAAALELARLGRTELAENRLDGLEEKARAARAAGVAVRWHFVGHVQRNKARRVARLAAVIHSVDSLALARTLERVAAEEELELEIFLEAKVSGEREKHGFDPRGAELAETLALAAESARLRPLGLMGMAPRPEDAAPGAGAARGAFARLRELGASLPSASFAGGAPRLSMGMSGDLEDAVAEGSHVLRIGRAVFEGVGARAGGRTER